MQHFFWLTSNTKKSKITRDAVKKGGRSMIFCRTRRGVDRVGKELRVEGLKVAVIHGGLSQNQRDRAMNQFIYGDCAALVATDVAARGIDVEGVQCVIHYDPPENGKAYKHRSGRTARAGAHGSVISLVQNPQKIKAKILGNNSDFIEKNQRKEDNQTLRLNFPTARAIAIIVVNIPKPGIHFLSSFSSRIQHEAAHPSSSTSAPSTVSGHRSSTSSTPSLSESSISIISFSE